MGFICRLSIFHPSAIHEEGRIFELGGGVAGGETKDSAISDEGGGRRAEEGGGRREEERGQRRKQAGGGEARWEEDTANTERKRSELWSS